MACETSKARILCDLFYVLFIMQYMRCQFWWLIDTKFCDDFKWCFSQIDKVLWWLISDTELSNKTKKYLHLGWESPIGMLVLVYFFIFFIVILICKVVPRVLRGLRYYSLRPKLYVALGEKICLKLYVALQYQCNINVTFPIITLIIYYSLFF